MDVRVPLRSRSARRAALLGAGALAAGLLVAVPLGMSASSAQTAAPSADWAACVTGSSDRQATFARAAQVSGVPEQVLLAVSYMESRWDVHGSSPSTAGGFGPMNLTDLAATSASAAAEPDVLGKGDPAARKDAAPRRTTSAAKGSAVGAVETLRTAHTITGYPESDLRGDAVANICGGAAVLAHFQRTAGGASALPDWAAAVARYSGAADEATASQFVDQVFATMSSGETRTTNDGQQVRLAATPGIAPARTALAKAGLAAGAADAAQTHCPTTLACEWVPAPYEQYGSTLGDYGNHDLADRPATESIDYIVIHDMDGYYDSSLKLVQDPTYLGWHYSIRSVDGHVANHMDPKDVGWHAGNWYVNAHSVGVEHEGFATQASWYTEAEYQSSATLVAWLAHRYGVPLDKAHIIGHDQVPGIASGSTRSMHWDPGPYWDWSHYFDLVGAPLRPDRTSASDIWTVKPAFAPNPANAMTGCDTAGEPCPADRSTDFVNVYSSPSLDAPLIADKVMGGSRAVANWGPRLAPGQKVVVDARRDDGWWGVWFAGQQGWVHNPDSAPVLLPAGGQVVTPKGDAAVPVYGRAYPEEAAYAGTGVPYQKISPLEYTIPASQQYVLADASVPADYYKAWNYNCQQAGDGVPDCVTVTGTKKYYEIYYNHRVVYVAADDVDVLSAAQAAREVRQR